MPRLSPLSAQALGLHDAGNNSHASVSQGAGNDPKVGDIDIRPPFVDRSSGSNVARLAEYTEFSGKYLSLFKILNKLEIDFSPKEDNINDIKSSEMKAKLLELVSTLRLSADFIEKNVLSAGPTDSLDVLQPATGTLASEIRQHVFGVFRSAATIIGRAGYASIVEDTRAMVHRLISHGQVTMYSPASGGKLNEDPESWIKTAIAARLDSDMTSPKEDGQIAAFNLSVYKDDGNNPRLKRFYDSLAYWRRNRLRGDQSAATLVAARAYGRKKHA